MIDRNPIEPVHAVQSCITNVSFPQTLEGLRKMVAKHRDSRHGGLDLDSLLEPKPRRGLTWTAPKWMTEGDVLFFYHAASARARITHLQKEVRQSIFPQKNLMRILEHASDLARQYSRTLFACAEISGPSEYEDEDEDDLLHFKGHIFAPLGRIHVFEYPLGLDEFADYVKISPASALTPLYGHQFEAVKQRLAEQNSLPDFLQNATASQLNFRSVNQTNWRMVSCAPTTKFIDEAQIREFLLNYLLAELRDVGTPLLQECRCFRHGHQTGIADYFISLNGKWTPVEAKLNMLSERDIVKQVAKYVHVDAFTPTKGTHRSQAYTIPDASICIVVDQLGIYIVDNGRFTNCNPGEPLWRREQLQHVTTPEIRNYLSRLV